MSNPSRMLSWSRLETVGVDSLMAKLEKLLCPGRFLTGAVEKKAHLAHNIEHTVESAGGIYQAVHPEPPDAVAGPRRNRLSAHYSRGLGLSFVLTLNKTYLRTAYCFTSLYPPILCPDLLDGHWNEYQDQYYLSKFNKLLSKIRIPEAFCWHTKSWYRFVARSRPLF